MYVDKLIHFVNKINQLLSVYLCAVILHSFDFTHLMYTLHTYIELLPQKGI